MSKPYLNPVEDGPFALSRQLLNEARAMAWILAELGEPGGNNLQNALADAPEDTHGWLHEAVAYRLDIALNEIETELKGPDLKDGA